jgi:hypothetical protein
MISNTGLTVTLTLDDKISAGMDKVKSNFQKLAKDVDTFAHSIQQAGRQMTFLGTALVGPMALAFNTASKYSIEANNALKSLSASSIDFQKTIAESMLPIVEKLAVAIDKLNSWFKSLDKGTRDMIIQGALLAGIFLLIVGPLMSVIARIAMLTSGMIAFIAANAPLLLIVGALIAIIYWWDQTKVVVLPVIAAIEVALYSLAIAYETVKLGMLHVAAFAASSVGAIDIATKLEEEAIKVEQTIAGLQQKISNAMSGGGTASVIDSMVINARTSIQSFIDFLTGQAGPQISSTFQQWGQSFEQTFNTAYQNAVNIGQNSANILVSQINMFSSRFGQAFSDMIMKGKNFGESMKALFTDMVGALIAAVVQMLVQWVIYQVAQMALVAASVGMAATIAAAWATAAAMVSLATMGANSVGAMAGIASTVGFSKGISMLAEGGIVTRPTLALIGEAGPEAVIPLGKGGAGTVINIEINNPNVSSMSDIDTLTEEISRRLNNEIERL